MSTALPSIADLDVADRIALVRVDFNVPSTTLAFAVHFPPSSLFAKLAPALSSPATSADQRGNATPP